ncbi:MAG: hypothetical protein Q7W02_19815 [Candidatus Rokubacteria bacterium]|nr:hypothetical protein [Candidatus Rokubacteria bacterium]
MVLPLSEFLLASFAAFFVTINPIQAAAIFAVLGGVFCTTCGSRL